MGVFTNYIGHFQLYILFSKMCHFHPKEGRKKKNKLKLKLKETAFFMSLTYKLSGDCKTLKLDAWVFIILNDS